MVVSIVCCICLIVLFVVGLRWCSCIKKEEMKTQKHKQTTYDKWYDLGVLLSDIAQEKNQDKGE